jgi:methyltransferase (TIGR00027 family)
MVHQSTARTSFYDAAVQRHLSDVDQFVVLGAGFDTRAFRLPPGGRTRCFEIDMPRTLAYKVRMLEKADLSTGLATYVPADFETEDWMEKLVAAGFDPARPALFIWEAVTMYLDGGAVQATLRKIAAAAPGSAVAFDYFSREIVASRSPYMRYARAATRFVGEPLTFGIDNAPPARKSAADFVGSFGLVLEEHRNFGRETRRRSAPAGFVTAVVTSGPANRAEHRNEGKP